MKNSIYCLMMFISLALIGCEPMEEIHEEVDQRIENTPVVGISEYTLVEGDYEVLNIPAGNFNSLEDAAALIPGLLAEKFPVWGEGSLAQVTFDLYAPINPEEYTVSESGYEAIGLDVDYFSSTSEIKDFLEFQFPQANFNDYVELTYRAIAVEKLYELDDEDFDLIEEELVEIYPEPADNAGYRDNFDRRADRETFWSNEMILEAINIVLEENVSAVEGQTYEVSYPIYDGNPGTESLKVRYDGNSYVLFGAEKYTLTNDDYDLIGTELGEVYPGPAGNAAQFNSFDVNEGSDNFWSDEMILEAINVVLKERLTDAEEGEQFDVTIELYRDGSTPASVWPVVLADGTYVESETTSISTIMETTVFAFGDGTWNVPLELPSDIYTEEFEQRFNNFDDEDVAGFYIGRWLELRYPYAQEGDFASVAYTYTYVENDERIYTTRYASFIYTAGGDWEFIPSIIPQTLQFGHEGTGWVVDNTIVYQLTTGDYEFIGEQFDAEYPDPAWSVGNYGNFDRRQGTRNYWSTEMIIEAMNVLLNERVAPDAPEGQKYLLIFDIYDGTNTTEQLHLIKVDGVWVPVS